LSVSSIYFLLFFKYNQPESTYDSSQQCYLNEYHCSFNFTEKTLLTCIDLLYADENLQQSPQQLLFYDDLLNGMMFLGLSDDYFIKILTLLRTKLLSLTGDVENINSGGSSYSANATPSNIDNSTNTQNS
ncbi:unnamed protein product, partial [Adineta steineri]